MKKTNGKILKNIAIILALSCMTILGASYLFADVVYENSLVSYWDFDDGNGSIASDATGVNNGNVD